MAHGESSPPPGPAQDSRPGVAPLPPAWQPLTPRGVAAFAQARVGRLWLVQFLIAALVAGASAWFLNTAWFPVALQAIRQLPDTGAIVERRLESPHESASPLAENRFLSVFVNPRGVSNASTTSDLRLDFREREIIACSILGCVVLAYPAQALVPFNRVELEPWWGAWESMILGLAALAVMAALWLTWQLLGALYAPVAWVLAYFNDRPLTLPGSWKLASAALLPGALFTLVGIVAYGWGMLDLPRFLLLWALHLFVGWYYVFTGVLMLRRAVVPSALEKNPFDTAPAKVPRKARPSNPCSDSTSETPPPEPPAK